MELPFESFGLALTRLHLDHNNAERSATNVGEDLSTFNSNDQISQFPEADSLMVTFEVRNVLTCLYFIVSD